VPELLINLAGKGRRREGGEEEEEGEGEDSLEPMTNCQRRLINNRKKWRPEEEGGGEEERERDDLSQCLMVKMDQAKGEDDKIQKK
jgi:hypothetical protein